jgi:hypothetical protein
MKRRRLVISLGVLTLACVGLGFGLSAAASTETPTAGAPPCAPGTPSSMVSTCENRPQVNPTRWPSTPPPGQGLISMSRAIDIGRTMALGKSSAPDSIPASAQQMTYQDATSLVGDGANPEVASTTPVWVVTVHDVLPLYSPPPADTNPAPDVFTVIVDAANGEPIDACGGCAAIP